MKRPDSERQASPGWIAPEAETGGRSVVSLSTLGVIVVVCTILYIGKDLFLPLALGMLIAFILTPVVNFLRRRGLRDTPAVLLTVAAAAAMVGSFVIILGYQIGQIGANLPLYQGNVLSKVDTLLEAGGDNTMIARLQDMVDRISERVAQGTENRAPASPDDRAALKVELVEQTSLKDWVTGVILPALAPVGIFGLVFVVVVFALLERAALRDKLVQLIGGSNILATSRLLAEAGSRLADYLFAQLVVNIIYAVPIWLGLWLIGVPNALFFGIVTLVMRFVPYIGSAVSALLPLLMAFAISPDWSLVLWTAALFLGVELVTSNAIEPYFYGQRTGVSPFAVIVSAMFWTWLWGPMGLIIATPLTVCLVVMGHHVPSLRLFSIMLGDRPVMADSAQLYDRLLAGHSFAFTETASQTTMHRYLSEYYDRTALPALALAQADAEAGLLSEAQARWIATAARQLTEDLEPVVEDELAEAAETPAEPGDRVEGTTLLNNGVLDGLGHRVAVVGARTGLDDAAARMLAQAMRAEGADTLPLPHRSGLTEALRSFEAETIVIASLDGQVGRPVELLLRHLRRRFPKARIGLAQWAGAQPGPDEATAPTQPGPSGADFVALGMEAVMTHAFRD